MEAFDGSKARRKSLGNFLSRQSMSSYIRGHSPFLSFLIKDLLCILFNVMGCDPKILCRVFWFAWRWYSLNIYERLVSINVVKFFYHALLFMCYVMNDSLKGLYKTPKGQVRPVMIRGFPLTPSGYFQVMTLVLYT